MNWDDPLVTNNIRLQLQSHHRTSVCSNIKNGNMKLVTKAFELPFFLQMLDKVTF